MSEGSVMNQNYSPVLRELYKNTKLSTTLYTLTGEVFIGRPLNNSDHGT